MSVSLIVAAVASAPIVGLAAWGLSRRRVAGPIAPAKPPRAAKNDARPSSPNPTAEQKKESTQRPPTPADRASASTASPNLPTVDDGLDTVTRLPNRRAFDQSLAEHLAEWNRTRNPLSAMLVGVDRRDGDISTLAQNHRDAVLRSAADALQAVLEGRHVVARYSNLEFGILLDDTDLNAAADLAEQVRMSVAAVLAGFASAGVGKLVVSVGVTAALAEEPAECLLRRCDSARHASRTNGGKQSYFSNRGKCLPVLDLQLVIVDDEPPPAPRPRAAAPQVVDELKLDRRGRRRAQYRQRALVAPARESGLPQPGDFFDVMCHDISANGIAFLLPQPPEASYYVMALRKGSETTFMRVAVARTAPVEVDGGKWILVGCSFAGRVEFAA